MKGSSRFLFLMPCTEAQGSLLYAELPSRAGSVYGVTENGERNQAFRGSPDPVRVVYLLLYHGTTAGNENQYAFWDFSEDLVPLVTPF